MGQHPSKRRSYTPGHDAQTEIPSPRSANGDLKIDVTANGGLAEHDEAPEPISPTSITSNSSAGKKDKRRKLRFVGFPIRRTPSGRWTRKRRSVKANGANTRPVSCPVASLTGEPESSIQRPQSLFAHEFEVHEEEGDGKVETVDLSDTEEGKTKQETSEAAPIPKPREKKAKRMSDKKAENKKKKKDKKKDMKKDKDALAASVDSFSDEKLSDPKEDATVEDLADTSAQKPCSRTEEVDMSNSEGPKDDPDLTSMAASIVQDTVNNARQKLMAEQNFANFISEANQSKNEGETPHPISVDQRVEESSETIPSSAEGNLPSEVIEDAIIPAKALEKNNAMPLLLGLDNAEMETEAVNSHINEKVEGSSLKGASHEIMDGAEVVEIVNEDITALSTVSKNSEDELTEVMEEPFIEQRVDKVRQVPDLSSYITKMPEKVPLEGNVSANINAKAEYQTDDGKTERISDMGRGEANSRSENDGILNTTSENVVDNRAKDSEAFASTNKVSAGKVESSPQNTDRDHAEEVKENFDKISSDTEQNKDPKANISREQKDKEHAEKEHQRRQREKEKAKEKERVREEKRKKVEEKAGEKLKTKGDRKSLPQRISSWFKKDKPKLRTSTSPETPSEKLSHPVDESVSNSSEHPGDIASSRAKKSLTVDVSVQPYSGSQDIGNSRSSPNSSPTEEDIQPDSAQISPTSEANVSLNSDSSIPVCPTSDDPDADTGGPPGALKKIILGPRLRTAILRKKSSSASDSGQEDKRVSLTQPKSIETSELTPPPRKLRQRKAADQYTPVTKGAHNPPKIQSPQLEHCESNEASAEDDLKRDIGNVPLSLHLKETLHIDGNTEALPSSVIVEDVNETSKSSEEQGFVDTNENNASSFPEAIVNKNVTHTGEESELNENAVRSTETHGIIIDSCEADISQSEDKVIVNCSDMTSTAEKGNGFNKENIISLLKEEIVDCGEGITPSITKELNDNVDSASLEQGSCDASKKDNVTEEICQITQSDSATCHSLQQANFPSQQLQHEFDETIEKGEASHGQISITTLALDLSVDDRYSIQPKENEGEKKESPDVEHSIDSPSLISTATIVFKSSISDNSPPCSPTTEELNEIVSNNLSEEVQEVGNALPAEANDITESNQTGMVDLTESNKATQETEVQSSNTGSLEERNVYSPELNVPNSEIMTQPSKENECITPSLESQEFERDTTEGTNDTDASEFTAVCLEKDHESVTESVTEQNSITEDVPRPSGEDSLKDDQLAIKLLDNHNLDDSAIEMDKDIPLVEDRTACPNSVSKEDDGVGSSDNSSDCNDVNKSGPSATIDAYLKLQHADLDFEQAASEINGFDLSSTE